MKRIKKLFENKSAFLATDEITFFGYHKGFASCQTDNSSCADLSVAGNLLT